MIPINGITGLLLLYLIIFIGWILTFALIYLSIFNSKYFKFWFIVKSNPVISISVLILIILSNCFGCYVYYKNKKQYEGLLRADAIRKSRQVFTLTEPKPYGEIILPAGTKIFRYDPFDNGEEVRAFRLTGLERAEFPHPVKMANLMVNAMDPQGKLWLAERQQINGDWYEANQVVYFQTPPNDYDVVKEFGKERPDGVDAWFKPSQWVFKKQIESVEMDVPAEPFIKFRVK